MIKSARDDGWEISVGFLVAMPILVLLFAGAVVIAIKMTGAAGYVAIVVAVLLGIYLAWTLALVLIGGLIARVVKGIAKNASARRPGPRRR